MPAFRIAVIGGDGIGPEVIEQAIRVADLALRQESGAASNGIVCPGAAPSINRPGR